MTFAAAALRQQEIARLSDAMVPRLDAMRRMTPQTFRALIADMLHRFGHEIVTDCPRPRHGEGREKIHHPMRRADRMAAGRDPPACGPARRGYRRRNAARGFFITLHGFTHGAAQYAACAPLDLFDGKRLVKALHQSRTHVPMPQTYNAMCRQSGEIVQHRLDREQDEARPCGNGHLVAPTIARAMLVPPRPPANAAGTTKARRRVPTAAARSPPTIAATKRA